MSRYGIVEAGFWQNAKIKPLSDTDALMLIYLFSCPHGNSIGCFVLPEGYITADRPQWGAETVRDTLSRLGKYGFIDRDAATNVTRVVGWFGHSPPANGKVVVSMLKRGRRPGLRAEGRHAPRDGGDRARLHAAISKRYRKPYRYPIETVS
jgi:hypothetical protein